MKLKEQIYHSMTTMDNQELCWLYEQIRLMQRLKQNPSLRHAMMTIEYILTMTSSSKGCWSDTVIEERSDRI